MKMFNVSSSQRSKQISSEIGSFVQSKSRLLNLIGNFSYNPSKNLLVLYFDDGEQVYISSNSSSKNAYKVSRMGIVGVYNTDKDLFDYLWKIKIGKI
jgi:hypothetical protein